ncbi:MAG: YIP1 family protein [Bacteroidales bacterium]|nr:YIP1 family protein [Bacteroidales bacterium]
MNESAFDFKKFIDDSKETLINPKSYFASMKLSGGMGEPIIKALIYSVIAAVFSLIWSFFMVSTVTGGLFGGAVGIAAFFITIIGGIIGVFIAALIILIISSICGGNSDFEANLRVAASLMVLFPISTLLSVFKFNYYLGEIVGLAVNLYSLYLLYIAVTVALKGKDQTAKIISYVLAGIVALFFIISMSRGALYRTGLHLGASKYQRELQQLQGDLEEVAKDMESRAGQSEDDMEYGEDRYSKPENFPAKALGEVQEHLSSGASVLSADKIQSLIDISEELEDYGEDQSDEINNVLQSHGYNSLTEYTTDMLAATSGFAAVGSLAALEELDGKSGAEKKSAEMFEMDKALKMAASQSITLGRLTEKDLYTVYENWDMLVELDRHTQK